MQDAPTVGESAPTKGFPQEPHNHFHCHLVGDSSLQGWVGNTVSFPFHVGVLAMTKQPITKKEGIHGALVGIWQCLSQFLLEQFSSKKI